MCSGCGRHFSFMQTECPYCKFKPVITTGGTSATPPNTNDDYIFLPSCENCEDILNHNNDYKFCPYCGTQLRVV